MNDKSDHPIRQPLDSTSGFGRDGVLPRSHDDPSHYQPPMIVLSREEYRRFEAAGLIVDGNLVIPEPNP